MVEPTNLNPRRRRSFESASDSALRAGTSRGGFAIHVDQHSNQSQGCIVLETTADFQQLVKVLRANCVFPVRVQADYSVKRAKKCGG